VRFKVFKLRHKGRRLPWREVINGPSYVGNLQSHFIEHRGQRYSVITLMSIEAPVAGCVIADLYEPVLLGFAPLAFRLRGFERWDGAEGAFSVVQEWHVEQP
jgi:hypothetical protein